MLYSGLNILHRSAFWSANFNGRSDNTDVIPLTMIRQFSIRTMLVAITFVAAAIAGGFAAHRMYCQHKLMEYCTQGHP